MSASATAGQNVEPGPEGSRPISQTPGQGSPRLATLYAILGVPLAVLGAALLLFPGASAGFLFGSAARWGAARMATSITSLALGALSLFTGAATSPFRAASWLFWLTSGAFGKTFGAVFQNTLTPLLRAGSWTGTAVASVIGLGISRVVGGWLGWFLGFSWVRNLARRAVITATGRNFTMLGEEVGSVAAGYLHPPLNAESVVGAATGLGEVADGALSPDGSGVIEGFRKVAEVAVGRDAAASVSETLQGLKTVGEEAIGQLTGGKSTADTLDQATSGSGYLSTLQGYVLQALGLAGAAAGGGKLSEVSSGLKDSARQAAGAAMTDGSLKGVAAKIAAATPEGRMYDTELRLLGIALLGAALLLYLLQKAARAGTLGLTPHVRCNTALAVWSILTLGILTASVTIFSAPTLMLLSVIATATLVVTLPQVLSTDLPASADRTATDMVMRQTRRGRIYATLAVAFALEGVGLMLTPGVTLRGAFGMDGGPQGRALWQLIGASAHVIIPVVQLVLAAASDEGRLAAQLNVWLNALVGATAGVHVLTLLRHGLFGPVGALGPPVLLTWASALGTALYNAPSRVKPQPGH